MVTIQNYEVIENTANTLAVKINVAAYTASLIRSANAKGYLIAFNTNFFWNKIPIGTLLDGDKVIFTYPSRGIRPTLRINQLTFEAGPQLLDNGLPCWSLSFNKGQYSGDVIRRADHIAAGYTSAHKLIVVYKKNASIIELANYLQAKKCLYGLNLDGGSSAYLKVNTFYKGTPKITVGVGFKPT